MLHWFVENAWATYEVPDHISIDMASMGGLALMIITALASIWVLRKLIKFVNRS